MNPFRNLPGRSSVSVLTHLAAEASAGGVPLLKLGQELGGHGAHLVLPLFPILSCRGRTLTGELQLSCHHREEDEEAHREIIVTFLNVGIKYNLKFLLFFFVVKCTNINQCLVVFHPIVCP